MELHMVGKVMDKLKVVKNDYKFDYLMLLLMNQEKYLKLVLPGIVVDVQMNWVMNIEFVVKHRIVLKIVDIENLLMNNIVDDFA